MDQFKTHILLSIFLLIFTIAKGEIRVETTHSICSPASPGSVTLIATGTAGPFSFQWLGSEERCNNMKMIEAATFAHRSETGTQSRDGLKTLASRAVLTGGIDLGRAGSKILNLEVANKLSNLGLHPNSSEAVKQIRKIIKSIDVAGDDGIIVLNKIKSGEFDNVQGYISLLNKSADPGFFNALKQTMSKADEAIASSYPPNRLVFEDEAATYDVDFGIKTVSGDPIYEKAFQLKSLTTPNAVKNNLDPTLVERMLLFELKVEVITLLALIKMKKHDKKTIS